MKNNLVDGWWLSRDFGSFVHQFFFFIALIWNFPKKHQKLLKKHQNFKKNYRSYTKFWSIFCRPVHLQNWSPVLLYGRWCTKKLFCYDFYIYLFSVFFKMFSRSSGYLVRRCVASWIQSGMSSRLVSRCDLYFLISDENRLLFLSSSL